MRGRQASVVVAVALWALLLPGAADLAAQTRPGGPGSRPAAAPVAASASWRAAVVSPARSDALAWRSMVLPASVQSSYGAGGRPPAAAFLPPCLPWCPLEVAYTSAFPMALTTVDPSSHYDAAVGWPATRETCATVEVRLGGRRWRTRVALPALGAWSPGALFAGIARELAAGRQVALRAPDGTAMVLPAGPGVSGLIVDGCETLVRRR